MLWSVLLNFLKIILFHLSSNSIVPINIAFESASQTSQLSIFYGIRTHCLGTNLNPVLNYRSSHIQTDESAKSFQILGGWPRHRGLSLPCQAETFVRLLFGFLLKVKMYTYLHFAYSIFCVILCRRQVQVSLIEFQIPLAKRSIYQNSDKICQVQD